MPFRFARSLVLFSLTLLLSVPAVRAQWLLDGTPYATVKGSQTEPAMVPDGAGGVFLAWIDFRSGDGNLYIQRINNLGVSLWTADGVLVCNAANDQANPALVPDGSGGVIVTWEDPRTSTIFPNIYAQRVNASGAMLWTANGVALATTSGGETHPQIISDAAAGAIVTWEDGRNVAPPDIYARRINSTGVPQWTANGVSICTSTGAQNTPNIVTDAAGGAIISWQDNRSGIYKIYARRVNSSGVAQWTAEGNLVCSVNFNSFNPVMTTDGTGGAIIAWVDTRYANQDIFAQRVNGSGVMQWTTDGTALCTEGVQQYEPHLVSDGASGAIVSWTDNRGSAPSDIYARRVNASGAALWTINGVPIGAAGSSQASSVIVSDGAGGAIIAFKDYRQGTNWDLYAQRITANGLIQWEFNGSPISTDPGDQVIPVCAADGAGGVIVAWVDARSGDFDLFAQRLEGAYGYWGHPEPVVTKVADIPHDQGGRVAINWTASGRDLTNPRTIDHYSIWRAVNTFPSSAGTPLTDIAKVDKNTRGPVYAALAAVPGYYWELVATQEAHAWPAYSFAADTRADSIAGAPANEAFMVAAHDQYDSFVAFASNALTGHSVDNLAPVPPLALVAQRVGNYVHLKWNGVHIPDIRDYAVYRKTSAGVTPVPLNFLSNSGDTLLTDINPPASAAYYIVTAADAHGNQSTPSNEAVVASATGVGNLPPITALTVLQNHPNPFVGETELSIGLPAPSDVSVAVFDVAGRKVSTIDVKKAGAGWQKIAFSGRDTQGRALASGVYFYRVSANGTTVTRKMVITR